MKDKSYSKTHTDMARPAKLSILFLLSQGGEKSAYAIKSYIDQIGLQEWVPTSMVTVYKALKRLADTGLVERVSSRKGDGGKKVANYKLTEIGRTHLEESLKHELSTYSQDYFRFDLGIGLSSFIADDVKIKLLKQRIAQLRKALKEARWRLKHYNMNAAFGGWIILDHRISHLKNELSWMERLIKLLSDREINSYLDP